jgi:hypothetical protein
MIKESEKDAAVKSLAFHAGSMRMNEVDSL